ncbi:MAG: hypothetical protein PVG49_03025 [Desulfobacteraceae bacterium]|jgi:predicted amino acid dehydrogenase
MAISANSSLDLQTDEPDFALIGHPFDMDHLYRYLKHHKPDLQKPRRGLLLKLFEWTPPFVDRQIEIASPGGRTVRGDLIICPLLPEMIGDGNHSHFRNLCLEKVIASLKLASSRGAKISGLGGFTSIADGDQGRLVAKKVPGLSVTSGNTLTAMSAVDGVITACAMFGRKLSETTATVVGASGDIGTGCCRYLASRVNRLILVSRFAFNLNRLADELHRSGGAEVVLGQDRMKAIRRSDIVIAAASSVEAIFRQDDFKPGTIVCDVGYPKNIFLGDDVEHSNIFLFAGGLMTSSTPVFMPYDMGLPDDRALYGCWSEAAVLALDRRYESFSLGRGNIVPEKMERIWALAMAQGFRRAPFFYGKKLWGKKDIERIMKLSGGDTG